MPVYPEEIASLIRSPRSVRFGCVSNAAATEANFDCGCFIRVEMIISNGQIGNVCYRTNGCGYMVAAAEILAKSLEGCLLTELSGVSSVDIQVPDERRECQASVTLALRSAFAAYRQKQIDEFRGEKPLICTCFGVTEDTIVQFVTASRPRSVDAVSTVLKAGSGCGSCKMLIQEIIDAND